MMTSTTAQGDAPLMKRCRYLGHPLTCTGQSLESPKDMRLAFNGDLRHILGWSIGRQATHSKFTPDPSNIPQIDAFVVKRYNQTTMKGGAPWLAVAPLPN